MYGNGSNNYTIQSLEVVVIQTPVIYTSLWVRFIYSKSTALPQSSYPWGGIHFQFHWQDFQKLLALLPSVADVKYLQTYLATSTLFLYSYKIPFIIDKVLTLMLKLLGTNTVGNRKVSALRSLHASRCQREGLESDVPR